MRSLHASRWWAVTALSAALLLVGSILFAAPASANLGGEDWFARSTEVPDRPEAGVSRLHIRTAIYIVKPGDTLSKIDTKTDSPGPWERLAWVNREKFDNPHVIEVGERLKIPTADGRRLKWTPPPSLPSYADSLPSEGSSDYSSSPSYGSGACGGSLPTCDILACESGGNITAENPTSSASGKWQIIDSTWGEYKGYPTASSAPEHIQDERAAQIWAGGAGRGQWEC